MSDKDTESLKDQGLKHLLILLILIAYLPSAFAMGAKQPNTLACETFSGGYGWGNSNPQSPLLERINPFPKKHKVKHGYSDCYKEIYKERDKVKKDLKQLNEQIEKKLKRTSERAKEISRKVDERISRIRERTDLGEKRQSRVFDRKKKADGFYKEILRKKWRRINKRRDERNDKHYQHIETLKRKETSIENPKIEAYLDLAVDEMIVAFLEKKPKYENKTDEEIVDLMFSDTNFTKDYFKEHLPGIDLLVAEKLMFEERLLELRTLATQMCSQKELACPLTKDNFMEDPSLENYKTMLSTVGTVYHTDDAKKNSYVVNLDIFNFKTIMDKQSKHITNDKSKDRMEEKYQKAKSAMEDLEWNMDPKNKGKEGYPRKISSACGSCSDLNKAFKNVKEAKDAKKFEELTKLFETVGCPTPKAAKVSCSEDSSKILKRNGLGQGDQTAPLSVDKAIDNALLEPKKINSLVQSLNEIGLMVELKKADSESGASSTVEGCPACEVVKKRIEELTVEGKEEYIIKDEPKLKNDNLVIDAKGEIVLQDEKGERSFRKPKEGISEEELTKLKRLKNIALKLDGGKCLTEDIRTEEPVNSCEKNTEAMRGFLERNPNPTDLTTPEKAEYENHFASYEAFVSEERKKLKNSTFNCCEDLIGDISGEILNAEKSPEIPDFISNKSNKIILAETLECMKCGADKNNDLKDAQYLNRNPHTNCDFWKKHIEGKTSGPIDGLYLGDKRYTVDKFIENEVYTCKEGPKKSMIHRARDWEAMTYSSEGKYGDFSSLNLQCFIGPDGETVNLTCCDLKASSPVYKDFVSTLEKERKELYRSVSLVPKPTPEQQSLKKWLTSKQSNQEADVRAQTFCTDVWKNGYADANNSKISDWSICEYKDKTYWKVNPEKVKLRSSGSSDVTAPSSKATKQ